MKVSIVAAAAGLAACFLLMGCETPQAQSGERLAKEEGYAPIGTFIPRKKGTGQGATQVGVVDKQELENQRNMGSSDQGVPGNR